MRSASRKPRVMKSTVRSPLRSSSALVATVVPIFTASIALGRDRRARLQRPSSCADAVHGGVAVALRILRQQLVRDERAVGPAGDDVGERAAAVDPELPAGGAGEGGVAVIGCGSMAAGANAAGGRVIIGRRRTGSAPRVPTTAIDATTGAQLW